jgi:predicted Na+-dependent transporter
VASIVATVADDLSALLVDIDVSATLFVLCAMLVGWALGTGLSEPDRAVLVIEAGVRNIGVALILGGAILSKEGFAIFATFLTGYFVIEIAIMLIYARRKAADHAAVPVHSGERHGDPCGFRREGPRADRDRDPRRHDRRGIP